MSANSKIAAMTTTRSVVGYAPGSHVRTFFTTRTNAMADVTAPVQADQIIEQGLAGWALVLDGAGATVSEHGAVPAHRLLGLPAGTPFTVNGRNYTATSGSASGYAYNGTDGVRYDLFAFGSNGRMVRVRFDARSRVEIHRMRLLVARSGVGHAPDPKRPDYFLCGLGGKFGPPVLKTSLMVDDNSRVDCKRCRVKLDNPGV